MQLRGSKPGWFMLTCFKKNLSRMAMPTMAAGGGDLAVEEAAQATKIRVFKWNEKLLKNYDQQIMDEGFLIIRSEFVNGAQIRKGFSEKVTYFELSCLLLSDINPMVTQMLQSSEQFLPHSIPSLSLQISNYLTRNFRSEPDPLFKPPVTVIVAAISIRMIGDCDDVFPPQFVYPDAPLIEDDDDDDDDLDCDTDVQQKVTLVGIIVIMYQTLCAV